MDAQFIHDCMESYRKRTVHTMSARERIASLPFGMLGWDSEHVSVLLGSGYPEVLCCRGLDAAQTTERLTPLLGRLDNGLLCFGASEASYEAIRMRVPLAVYHAAPRVVSFTPDKSLRETGRVLVISDSGCDPVVGEETAVTCEVMRLPVTRLYGAPEGNADSVMAYRKALRNADIVLVVSGKDSSLASLIRTMTARPVLAIPTSQGGAAGSLAAMVAVAETCAEGVTLCGTDNSYGAAWLASAYNKLPSHVVV